MKIHTAALSSLAFMALPTTAAARVVPLPASPEGIAQAIAALPALRDSLPAGEPVEMVLPAGRIRLSAPIVIDAAHGGTPAHRLILRGADQGASWLSGARDVPTRPAQANDAQANDAQASDASGHPLPSGTRVAEWGDLPFTPALIPHGTYVNTGEQGLLLFQGGQRLYPTRWPAQTRVTAVIEGPLAQGPVLRLPSDMPAALWGEQAAWVAAYWGTVWSYESAPLQGLNPASHSAKVAPLRSPPDGQPKADFYLANLVSQLGQSGRFYWPPAQKRALFTPVSGGGEVELAVATTLLRLQGAAHVTLRHIGFERASGDLVTLAQDQDVIIEDCHLRQSGRNGLVVRGGKQVQIRHTVVEQTGETGIILQGGDRASLTRGDNVIADSVVAEFGQESPTYRPGVKLEGVGNALRDSLITGGPHTGVMLWGNDLAVERNEISHVLRDAEDMGAVYMGADWTLRGTRLAGNYIHDLGGQRKTYFLSAIYLDDQFSSADISGNILVGGDHSIVFAGGRDNHATGNLMLSPKRASLHFDARGLTFQAGRREEFAAKAAKVPYQSALWLRHYPALATLTPENFGHPAGNLFAGNLVLGAKLVASEPADLNFDAMLTQDNNRTGPALDSTLPNLAQQRLPDGRRLLVATQAQRLQDLVAQLAVTPLSGAQMAPSANAGR
ncbi:hypothetical protein EOE18_12260 [Novosphingobium umbonatum]|uniref:Right-handed parallel beta-helix repeat-containing protein n=1 Tax=Novosphingobium umbonatum TaxID=1908524 RepID=A0A3S2VC97_9SPHN|nr:right-handed parallel beta-helix repeat-containing protein [Novosphingobium umbonatum]RVU04264.1 hypothetical protein EOE18_12260 [Novosphingobium umbonatum]